MTDLQRGKKQTVESAKNYLCEQFDLPLSVVENLSYMEILGNKRVVIDGCKGILEYTENDIRLSLPRGSILFRGSGLCFKTLSNGKAVISGSIALIEFE